MKKFKLFALAIMAMLSTNAFAQTPLASGGFKLKVAVAATATTPAKYEITYFAEDYTIPTNGIVTIPSTLPNSTGDDYVIIGIANNAFTTFDADPTTGGELRLKVTGVAIDAKIEYIGDYVFSDFGNLASVTFGTDAVASKLKYIGNSAFAKDPMLTSISFANCPDLKNFTATGEEVDYSLTTPAPAYTRPFVYIDPATAAVTANTTLTTIVLNEATNDFGTALSGLKNLATENIKSTKIRILAANAFDGDEKIETLELPAKSVYKTTDGSLDYTMAVDIKSGALNGSRIKTLTINGDIRSTQPLPTSVGVPQIPATGTAAAVPTLTTLTFKGDIQPGGIPGGAFAGNTKLSALNFEGNVLYDATATTSVAIAATAFANAGTAATATEGIKLTVTASKAVANSIDVLAFYNSTTAPTTAPDKDIYLSASALTADPNILRCKWDAAPATPGEITIESNDEVTYYAKFQVPGTAASNVAIKRGKGDVVVYAAYADGETIYMEPLYSAADKYVVEKGQAVIVKVKGSSSLIKTKDDGTKYIECSGTTDEATMNHKKVVTPATTTTAATTTYPINNEIRYDKHITNQALNATAGTGNTIYAVAKISTNGLKWKPISNTGTFYINDAFSIKAKTAAAGVRVVWLDEEGNATAIQKVETKAANDGTIYNLRGEKVNASYKGIVIKNGKKYIQK